MKLALTLLLAGCLMASGIGTPLSLAILKQTVAAGGSAPDAPTDPTFDDNHGASELQIGWTGHGGDGFEVWRSTGGAFSIIGTTGPATFTYTDTAFESGFDISYKVRATNAFGQSSYLTHAIVPAAPTGLYVVGTDASGTTIAWTDNSSVENGFVVECRYNGGDWQVITSNPFGADDDPTAANVGTYFAAYGGGEDGFGTGFVFGATQIDCSYNEFRVRSAGYFSYSIWTSTVRVAPSLTATDLSADVSVDDIVLTWTPTGENGTVSVYLSDGGGMPSLVDSGISEVGGTYTHALAAVIYSMHSLTYYIVTGNSGGNGPNSNNANITP